MNLSRLKILSARKWNDYFPLQIVYEWDEVMANELGFQMDEDSQIFVNDLANKRLAQLTQKVVRRSFLRKNIDSSFNYFSRSKYDYLSFLLYPPPVENHYIYQANFIPILIDCFEDVMGKVPHYFRKNKALFVTNVEVYSRLLNSSLRDKVRYVPLSISDTYFSEQIPRKTVDVIQVGRQNPVLHEWMLKVVERSPEIEYVYAKFEDGKHIYFSNHRGTVGAIETRKVFMDFIGSARIALLSSPGIDGGEKRTGGFNPVTPRFYEAAVKYCYIVARYPKEAADFVQNGIERVALKPETFTEFEETIHSLLKMPFSRTESYRPFIQEHLTSTISHSIKNYLQQL
jgi:hypothetical protein